LKLNEELRAKIEEADKKLKESSSINPDIVNQLSTQIAISESEKLFMLGLLKKIVSVLGIQSVNSESISKLSHIPESVLKDIEDKVDVLSKFKEKSVELEIERENLIAESNELREKLINYQNVPQNEKKTYESIAAELGGIIYTANKEKEEIIAKANGDALEIIARAKKDSEDLISRANMRRLSILEENEKTVAEFKEKYQYIKKEHDTITVKFRDMADKYSLRLSEISDMIANVGVNI
jgi:hypothetical protein